MGGAMIWHVFKMHVNFGKMVRPPMAFPCVDDVAVVRIESELSVVGNEVTNPQS